MRKIIFLIVYIYPVLLVHMIDGAFVCEKEMRRIAARQSEPLFLHHIRQPKRIKHGFVQTFHPVLTLC